MLEKVFGEAKAAGRAAFFPYVMAGDPDVATTNAILSALTGAGVDAIELGIPYSDPLADGPTIAAAAQRALRAGTRIEDCLDLVRAHRSRSAAPVVLFTYFNPIYQYGLERFACDAVEAGAAGAIVPDLPIEEGTELSTILAQEHLDMPLLVAPSTTPQRARAIAQRSTGFIYVVSRLGVTGARKAPNFDPLRAQVAMLREITQMPLAIGFGVSAPDQVREVATFADGIIVGSALIDAYDATSGEEAARRVRRFIEPLLSVQYTPNLG
jgi:tryptophan synthase alpha chain